MGKIIEVAVPDIGGATDVDVIEILVKRGDSVKVDDPLVTLEGDKASMEVPSTAAGVVTAIRTKVGDKISEGGIIVELDEGAASAITSSESVDEKLPTVEASQPSDNDQETSTEIVICVPDIGDAKEVDVIEIHLKKGGHLSVDDPMITLEGDKATMEVPATHEGVVQQILIEVGDKVSQGAQIAKLLVSSAPRADKEAVTNVSEDRSNMPQEPVIPTNDVQRMTHASPAVRRIARELDIELASIKGSGQKGRITKEDVKRHLKGNSPGGNAVGFPATPSIDFSQFGTVETVSLSKIKKLSGANLHRNWVGIPHVTQFDHADVTELEAFRQSQKSHAISAGVKLTPIVFMMKALVAALKAFPSFNASLSSDAENLILKSYYNIGVAVDTPNGLVVPVIRDVDKKSLFELARELGEISLKAREKGLSIKEMQGGCMTISSLGGIGGTAFTPIINAPEVAILGVSRLQKTPVFDDAGNIKPRLMMPLSLSYDHRVIDGAEAARFVVYLSSRLADIRTLLL